MQIESSSGGQIGTFWGQSYESYDAAIAAAVEAARQELAGKTLEWLEARIRRWREIVPDLALRSTFIVGFPGETDSHFAALLDFVEQAGLDRVGCFTYSAVEGAAANALAGQVEERVKLEREQASVDLHRAAADIADALESDELGTERVEEAGRRRLDAARRVQEAVSEAVAQLHALLDEEQREELASLIRAGAVRF